MLAILVTDLAGLFRSLSLLLYTQDTQVGSQLIFEAKMSVASLLSPKVFRYTDKPLSCPGSRIGSCPKFVSEGLFTTKIIARASEVQTLTYRYHDLIKQWHFMRHGLFRRLVSDLNVSRVHSHVSEKDH
jgi:hypothetical protein